MRVRPAFEIGDPVESRYRSVYTTYCANDIYLAFGLCVETDFQYHCVYEICSCSREATFPVTLLMPHKGQQWLRVLCALFVLHCRPFCIVLLLCELDMLLKFLCRLLAGSGCI